MSRTWTYTINAPEKWLNANDRPKWRPDTLIAEWKHNSSALARYTKIPHLTQCTITALLAFPDNRRRDAANYYPSIKAAIDGLVLAGVLTDDDDRFVLSLTIARMPYRKGDHGPKGAMQLTISEVPTTQKESHDQQPTD